MARNLLAIAGLIFVAVAESGVPGFSIDSWYGIVAPAGTPSAVIRQLNAEMVRIINTPAVVTYLAREGALPKGSTPEALATTMRDELAKWSKVIKSAGIKLD